MAWLKKKIDPLSDRSRALNQEIAGLEAQIKKLDAELQRNQSQSRSRSTAPTTNVRISHPLPDSAESSVVGWSPTPQEPIFETVDQNRLKGQDEGTRTGDHFNELGVRKYDLPALLRRLRNHFRGPSTTNPKLVSYLAAGGIQGLRPLRYEKRVERNRFIALVVFLFVVLLGIILVFVRRR